MGKFTVSQDVILGYIWRRVAFQQPWTESTVKEN